MNHEILVGLMIGFTYTVACEIISPPYQTTTKQNFNANCSLEQGKTNTNPFLWTPNNEQRPCNVLHPIPGNRWVGI